MNKLLIATLLSLSLAATAATAANSIAINLAGCAVDAKVLGQTAQANSWLKRAYAQGLTKKELKRVKARHIDVKAPAWHVEMEFATCVVTHNIKK